METDKKKLRAVSVAVTALAACVIMAVVDGAIKPPYAVKSAVKLVVFAAVPLLYAFLTRDREVTRRLVPKKKRLGLSLVLGVVVYALIVGGYFLLRGVIDFSAVTVSLAGGEGVTKDNFVFVAVYISFVNSFCEELMFRAFAFGALEGRTPRAVAYTFSALMFALYHVAIMSGWFHPAVVTLIIAALFAAGLVFEVLDRDGERGEGSIYPSWIVHIFANLGINTVGLVLFGIIG